MPSIDAKNLGCMVLVKQDQFLKGRRRVGQRAMIIQPLSDAKVFSGPTLCLPDIASEIVVIQSIYLLPKRAAVGSEVGHACSLKSLMSLDASSTVAAMSNAKLPPGRVNTGARLLRPVC